VQFRRQGKLYNIVQFSLPAKLHGVAYIGTPS
jgi:hypothetical protein